MTSFEFNGNDFSELLLVNDVQRPLLPTLNTVMSDVGSLKGTIYNYNSYSERELEVSYTLIADTPEALVTVKQTVAGLLFTDKPQRLIFSDSPDRYYLAIPDGEFAVDQISNVAQGTLRFIVPDGVAHAVNPKEFVAVENEDGILELVIDNQGTEECPVNIEANFTSENGVFAAVSPYSVIEVGNSEETDGHDYQVTDVVAKNTLTLADKPNWTENSPDARTRYPVAVSGVTNSFGTGSFTWPAGAESPTPNFTNRGPKKWAGPTLHRSFATNSNGSREGNFEAIWRFSCGNTKANQSGRQEFNLQNGTNIPFAFIYRDSSRSKVEAICEFYVKGANGGEYASAAETIDIKKLKSTWFEIRITRVNNKITYKLSNIKSVTGSYGNEDVKEAYFTVSKTFTFDWAATIPVDSTTYWAQAGDFNSPPTIMRPTNFTFRWINVDKYTDDPNRYQDGDQMFIDSYNGKVYLNGVPILNDVVKGSEYIRVPVGLTPLQFAYSDFGTAPAVKATIQEVYL